MEENGCWVTIKGNHIFIKDGQSIEEAFNEFLDKFPEAEIEDKDYESDLDESDIIEGRYDLNYEDEMNARKKDRLIKVSKPADFPDNSYLQDLGYQMMTEIYDFQDANENADYMSSAFKRESDERNNCQNCCLAYWARMMGMNVTAMPNNPGDVRNLFDLFENSDYTHISENDNPSPWRYTQADIRRHLFDEVKAAGNGAMYFVTVTWIGQPNKGPQKGHIFIVQNINGKPVCIEPQRNYYSSRQGDKESWLQGAESHWSTKNANNYFWKMKKNHGIRYLRVDNNKLKINNNTRSELKRRIIGFDEAEKMKAELDNRFNVKEVIER